MMFLHQMTSGVLVIALAACLAACGESRPAADAKVAAQARIANDCRSPEAQSAQRGCRPIARVLGKL